MYAFLNFKLLDVSTRIISSSDKLLVHTVSVTSTNVSMSDHYPMS